MLMSCAACDQLLHLDETTLSAPDAAVDAAHYTCDPLPAFTAQPMMYLASCTDYTSDSHGDQLAVAFCDIGGNGGAIQQGMPGSMAMTPADLGNDVTIKEVPRLAPAGDTLFVRTPNGAAATFRQFRHATGVKWVEDTPITFMTPFLPSTGDVISAPNSGAVDRHIIMHHTAVANAQLFVEIVETRFNGWMVAAMYEPGQLGVTAFADPYLSDDGLALWFVGTSGGDPPALFASIRTGLDAMFPPAHKVTAPTLPNLASPFLTRDCERLYISDGANTSYLLH